MSKEKNKTTKDNDNNSKNKKMHNKVKKHHYASNEDIIYYCIKNNLLYALMLWLEIDLDIKILRGGIIKEFVTTLGTTGYYFVSLDPNKQNIIKEMDITKEEYEDYRKSLYNELSVYLTESIVKECSAKEIFGRYVYNKMHDIKSDDIDLLAFVTHLKRFKEASKDINKNNIGEP